MPFAAEKPFGEFIAIYRRAPEHRNLKETVSANISKCF
jgi:hypothetical protein